MSGGIAGPAKPRGSGGYGSDDTPGAAYSQLNSANCPAPTSERLRTWSRIQRTPIRRRNSARCARIDNETTSRVMYRKMIPPGLKIQITESIRAQFRVEAFNVLNTPIFSANPDLTPTVSTSAGSSGTTARATLLPLCNLNSGWSSEVQAGRIHCFVQGSRPKSRIRAGFLSVSTVSSPIPTAEGEIVLSPFQAEPA